MNNRKVPFDHHKAAALLLVAQRNISDVRSMIFASFPKGRVPNGVVRIFNDLYSLRLRLQDGQESAHPQAYFGPDIEDEIEFKGGQGTGTGP